MTLRSISWVLDVAFGAALGALLPRYVNFDATNRPAPRSGAKSHAAFLAALSYFALRLVVSLTWGKASSGKKQSIYGLEHGRLHLQARTPMWMNMGYWRTDGVTQTLAEACRDLLQMVLREAGFERKDGRAGNSGDTRRKRTLIDVGFGCGDQTVYLMSDTPVRPCDKEWWDEKEHDVHFDKYIGITNNSTQHRHASERVQELLRCRKEADTGSSISVFCADAAKPESWDEKIQKSINKALENEQERWLMALDTAYHFSPSRWSLVEYAHGINASFMVFDLCLSPTATFTQKATLRILTALMGAPWANFDTPEEYRRRLVATGYPASDIKIVDVSDRVFAPLAQYLEAQDARLKTMGLSIGAFGAAKTMFSWWGRSDVIRGVIVVARR